MGQDRPHLGRRQRQGDRSSLRRFSSLQPRRLSRRHGVRKGQHPHLGCRQRQGDRGSGRRRSDFRNLQPDGSRIVTASWDNTARIWDDASAKEIAVLYGDSAAFSPDGSRVVTASEKDNTHIWDAASGKEIAVRGGGEVTSATFSPTGRASSRRHGTRPPASGTTPAPRRSQFSTAIQQPSAPTALASSRRQKRTTPTSGMPPAAS